MHFVRDVQQLKTRLLVNVSMRIIIPLVLRAGNILSREKITRSTWREKCLFIFFFARKGPEISLRKIVYGAEPEWLTDDRSNWSRYETFSVFLLHVPIYSTLLYSFLMDKPINSK